MQAQRQLGLHSRQLEKEARLESTCRCFCEVTAIKVKLRGASEQVLPRDSSTGCLCIYLVKAGPPWSWDWACYYLEVKLGNLVV